MGGCGNASCSCSSCGCAAGSCTCGVSLIFPTLLHCCHEHLLFLISPLLPSSLFCATISSSYWLSTLQYNHIDNLHRNKSTTWSYKLVKMSNFDHIHLKASLVRFWSSIYHGHDNHLELQSSTWNLWINTNLNQKNITKLPQNSTKIISRQHFGRLANPVNIILESRYSFIKKTNTKLGRQKKNISRTEWRIRASDVCRKWEGNAIPHNHRETPTEDRRWHFWSWRKITFFARPNVTRKLRPLTLSNQNLKPLLHLPQDCIIILSSHSPVSFTMTFDL